MKDIVNDDYKYWYEKADFFLTNQTKDKTTNLMLLASELRNQFRLGIEQGIKDSYSGHR